MAKFRLWFLNRAKDYDRAYLREQLEGDTFLGMGDRHEVEYGDRASATGLPFKFLEEGELMYEHSDADEYFVPIALKCLGGLGSLERALADVGARAPSAHGERLLRNIEAYYSHLYGPSGSWKDYWTPNADDDNTRNMRMATVPHRGLYEVLLRCRSAEERHVLVGYSQGGLVARFLAYIDEHITKAGIIHGVITVQSPNWGSPLARRANAPTVAEGILGAGAAIAGMTPVPGLFPGVQKFIRDDTVAAEKVTVDLAVAFLTAAISDYHALGLTDPAAYREREELFQFLATAKKWLSGLQGDRTLAFYDLGLDRYEPGPQGGEAYSVLALVNKYPPRDIFYGAVAGANTSLVDFVRSMLTKWWMKLGFDWKLSDLRPLVEGAGGIYRTVVMKEADSHQLPQKAQNRVDQYALGVGRSSDLGRRIRLSQDIPGHAHDFVIPTVFQTVPEPREQASDGKPRFLGNYINPTAAHISGASLDHREGGKKNQELVGRMLATIAASSSKVLAPPGPSEGSAVSPPLVDGDPG